MDIFGHFYLNHLSPLWGYFFPGFQTYAGAIFCSFQKRVRKYEFFQTIQGQGKIEIQRNSSFDSLEA